MGTTKIKAIWHILTARSFSLTAVRKTGVEYQNDIDATLAETMTLVIALERSHDSIVDFMNERATELGELKTLEALRESIDKANNVG